MRAARLVWRSAKRARAAKTGMRLESDASAESEIQEAMGVPPQEESMRPTGMCSRAWISRPKKKATAENSVAVAELHGVHDEGWSPSGKSLDFLSKRSRWIWPQTVGSSAEAISLSASLMTADPGKPRRGISILDWPEANHTSPTRMSARVIWVLP